MLLAECPGFAALKRSSGSVTVPRTHRLGGRMNSSRRYLKIPLFVIVAALAVISLSSVQVRVARAQSDSKPPTPLTDSDLVSKFRRVEVASVSDARRNFETRSL